MGAIRISLGLVVAVSAIPPPLQDPQSEAAGNRVRIAEDVPVLRLDHVSIKSTLPGVRSGPHSGERHPPQK